MTDYTIDSFTSGKKSFIGAYVSNLECDMEEMNNSHSSAYSSLTNSTNEISDPATIMQSPTPVAILHTSPSKSANKTRIRIKPGSETLYDYNNCQSSPSITQYHEEVTDLSNLSGIHDGYNSTASTISGSEQKQRRSQNSTLRSSCASPSTSTSIEIRNIIDDYNATLRRATKEIKGLLLYLTQNMENFIVHPIVLIYFCILFTKV